MVQILITFNPQDGSVSLNGPLAEKILMYGILESAKQIVTAYDPKTANRVELANGPLPPLPPLGS